MDHVGARKRPAGSSALLRKCARQLREDLLVLDRAYPFTRRVLTRFLAERTDGSLYHDITALYAAWVSLSTDLDEERYLANLDEVLRRRDQGTLLGHLLYTQVRGQHWGWGPPADEQGEAAVRLIDRIDLSLNYLRCFLRVDLPAPLQPPAPASGKALRVSIERGDTPEEREALIHRAALFASSAADLFA